MRNRGLVTFFAILLVSSLLLAGCGQTMNHQGSDVLHASWTETLQQAKGSTVTIYMWGGSDSINRYMDEWVAPRLKSEYDITLKRVPITDTQDVINKLLTEKQAGKTTGSADLIWINGENFKTAKDQGLLLGSFASKLPNVQKYMDIHTPDLRLDFGEETNGLEAPWGKAQFVFIYDQNKVPHPPKSMAELKTWIEQHPGKFTYPAPPDFTGSAFIRQALYETAGGYQQVLTADQQEFEQKETGLWSYLNEIKPNLWRNGETYPESLAKLDQLYANEEVWMTMGYDSARASNEIKKGTFPVSTRTFVLDQGTLSNTHYLSIPFNASNPAGAMVVINYLLSPEAQIAKYDPANWGDDLAIDPSKLSAEDQQKLTQIDRGVATLSASELAQHRVPELSAHQVEWLEKGWLEHVAKH